MQSSESFEDLFLSLSRRGEHGGAARASLRRSRWSPMDSCSQVYLERAVGTMFAMPYILTTEEPRDE